MKDYAAYAIGSGWNFDVNDTWDSDSSVNLNNYLHEMLMGRPVLLSASFVDQHGVAGNYLVTGIGCRTGANGPEYGFRDALDTDVHWLPFNGPSNYKGLSNWQLRG